MAAKLTPDSVRKIGATATGAITAWDTEVTGFGVRAYASGVKSFFLNYRLNGREKRHTIGTFPTWSVAAARERAKALRKQVDGGGDPAGERRERREAPTVPDLIDRYISDHLPKLACKDGNDPRHKDTKQMPGVSGEHPCQPT